MGGFRNLLAINPGLRRPFADAVLQALTDGGGAPVVKDLEKNSVACDWPAALALADIQDEVKRGKLAFGCVSHR